MNVDDRLTELETKAAYQEDLLQELNRVVIGQQRAIDRLERTCRLLREQLEALANEAPDSGGQNERPPHY